MPVLAETGGTGLETGEDDPASEPAAGAATAAGCPATKTQTCFTLQHKYTGLKANRSQFEDLKNTNMLYFMCSNKLLTMAVIQ